MIDVHVEAHADGIGSDEEIHFTGLIKRHLGVARARRQRAKHDSGAAALAADQFGDAINILG